MRTSEQHSLRGMIPGTRVHSQCQIRGRRSVKPSNVPTYEHVSSRQLEFVNTTDIVSSILGLRTKN